MDMKFSALYQLTLRDLRARYTGTMAGLLWSLLQPMAMMTILYWVFHLGMNLQGTDRFVPWLFVGMIAWNFFADALSSMNNCFLEYSFLVKKIKFPVHFLPCVKIASSLIHHGIFLVIVIVILAMYDIYPGFNWIQMFVLLPLYVSFLLGLGYIFSAWNVFVRDVSQMTGIVLQFGLWLTPVIWNMDKIPHRFQWILIFHPVHPFVHAYRSVLLEGRWLGLGTYVHLSLLAFGCLAFGWKQHRKFRPYFADVL